MQDDNHKGNVSNVSGAEDSADLPWFSGTITAFSVEAPEHARIGPAPAASIGEDGPTSSLTRRLVLIDKGEIARGGMGTIRRMFDPTLRRHLAMKVIDSNLASQVEMTSRFVDEGRITGHLDHANIVPVHDMVVDDNGTPSYTMKLVNGITLADAIVRQKTQRDLEDIMLALIKACDALAHAHERGIIHRDLKPENIMVGEHGQVYVMDWGCAHVFGADRSMVDCPADPDGIVMGTVQYMAPEQALGMNSTLDPRTDVFGLGAILYMALTGRPPYMGSFVGALCSAQTGNVAPPDQVMSGKIKPPPHLSQIAMKAMSADPKDRYQSASDFADALRAFLRGGNWFPLYQYEDGDLIVREGERADAAYIITSGTCHVIRIDPVDESRAVVLRVLSAGDVFGETAIFADAPRSASVVAVGAVSAVVVERTSLEKQFRGSWLGLFVKSLADRFIELDSR